MSFEQFIALLVKFWENIQYFIAGAVGASIVTKYHKDQLKSKSDYLVFILSGAFMAHYLTQFTVFIIGKFGWVLEASTAGSVGFLLGAFGGIIFQEITCYIKSGAYKNMSLREYFADMFKNWLNRKNEK